jgi:hypothetical protein
MQVVPKNDEMRKLLKHPSGVGFREKGPANWPNDSFTARRVRDGDITIVKEQQVARVADEAPSTQVTGEGDTSRAAGMRVTGDAQVVKAAAETPRPPRR